MALYILQRFWNVRSCDRAKIFWLCAKSWDLHAKTRFFFWNLVFTVFSSFFTHIKWFLVIFFHFFLRKIWKIKFRPRKKNLLLECLIFYHHEWIILVNKSSKTGTLYYEAYLWIVTTNTKLKWYIIWNIWHKSVRVGEILKPWYNYKTAGTSMWPEWL